MSYPLVRSWIRARRAHGKRVAVIHFDAHTDLLGSRQGIDLCFATWAYHILPDLERSEDLIQLGIRSSGKSKHYWENGLGVKQYWADEVLQFPHQVKNEITHYLKKRQIDEVYVSFDIDAMDEKYASATGTPEPDGLTPDIPPLILDGISSVCKVTGADLVEVAPWVVRVRKESTQKDAGEVTLETAGEIAADLLRRLQEGLAS